MTEPVIDLGRRAVRAICLDERRRIHLQLWRDPHDGRLLWEPPGGGIEPGEDEPTAAVREVLEETGLTVTVVPGRRVVVRRDLWWGGRRHVSTEPFLLATVDPDVPAQPLALNDVERRSHVDSRWLTWDELCAVEDDVEPPDLADVLRALDPDGPWNAYSTGR